MAKKATKKVSTPKSAPKAEVKKVPAKKEVEAKVKPQKQTKKATKVSESSLDQALSKKDKKSIAVQAKEKISEGISDLAAEYSLRDIFQAIRTLDFYTSENDECAVRKCENPATTSGYCRFHYISAWKDIKKRQKILVEGQLQEYIEGLVEKYPLKFIESLISDLTDEKSFFAILKEMDIDADEESYEDEEGEDDDQDIAFAAKSNSKESMYED